MKQIIYRHGDIYIFKVKKQKAEFKQLKRAVLAEGEVTGHAHVVTPDLATVTIAIAEQGADKFLRVKGGSATLRHEEHHAIKLPAGDYRIFIQREYDPLGNRKVMD